MRFIKTLLILTIFLVPHKATAYLSLETSYDYGRQEFNSLGYLTTFVLNPASNFKLIYQHRPNKNERFSWGLSYSYVKAQPASSNPYIFTKDNTVRTAASIYGIYVLPRGLYTRFGLSQKSSPYHRVTETSPDVVISVDHRTHIDPWLELGSFYKNGFGAGEVSLVYSMISKVEVDEEEFSGSGLEFYWSLYFNDNKNFGFFFRYINEFLDGSYDHVYDSRQMGLILRI